MTSEGGKKVEWRRRYRGWGMMAGKGSLCRERGVERERERGRGARGGACDTFFFY